jgi:cobalt-zinc-cadmium efflux system protein
MQKQNSQVTAASPVPPERLSRKRRMLGALVLTFIFFVVEVVGGFAAGSLALLADAAHMFTDVAALILAYASMTLADRAPTRKYTFGFYRAEILAAFVNAEVLLLVAAYIFYEAYRRLYAPPEIREVLMMLVALAGLAANLASMTLLHSGSESSLNMRAAYFEVLTDTLGSLAVVFGAIAIAMTGRYWIDPALSIGIGLLVVPRTISLLRQSAHILLEGHPKISILAKLRSNILSINGVEELHDLHFWTLTSGFNCASAHITASGGTQGPEVLQAVQVLLKKDTGVDHVTIQLERGSEVICEVSRGHD